jgi:peptidoglycan hydrolase CwlO-like protein
MPKSKASVDGDEQRQELQLLKQDVEENQNELSAIRAELSTVSCKQDQFHKAMDGMQGAMSDLSQQVTAMADTL